MRLLAAALLATTLAACTGDATGARPADLVGLWARDEVQSGTVQLHTIESLELRAEGVYSWTTAVYGPGGREADGLLDTFTHGGDWAVRDGRLALRTLHGMGWRVESPGGYQADFVAEWSPRHRIRLDGDRLQLTYLPRPEESSVVRTLVFHRVYE